jgi:hypothetical protein
MHQIVAKAKPEHESMTMQHNQKILQIEFDKVSMVFQSESHEEICMTRNSASKEFQHDLEYKSMLMMNN